MVRLDPRKARIGRVEASPDPRGLLTSASLFLWAHPACLWSGFGHPSTVVQTGPQSHCQEEGSDWPSLAQVSTTGPSDCFKERRGGQG